VVSSDSGADPDPLDPVYADLFRPETPRPDAAREFEAEPMFEPIVDPVVDPRIEDGLADALPDSGGAEAPAAPTPAIVDTGRLFRSQGVRGQSDAILALNSDHFGRLRTLDRRDEQPPADPPVIPVGGVMTDAGPVDLEDVDGSAAVAEPGGPAAVVEGGQRGRRRRHTASDEDQGASHRSRRISGGAVYIIVIGVTVLVGFANALLTDGDVGWPTGLALLVSSVYAALTVRRSDDVVAIIVPPLAFLLTAMTAGQLLLGSAEGSLLNRAVIVFFTLADNWMWIIGSTAAALVIVLVRRRRG
jgi:hypothetical protein